MTYTKRDYSISMLQANWQSVLITLPVVILLGLVYLWVWGIERPLSEVSAILSSPGRLVVNELIFLGVLVVGIVTHEAIHAVCWVWGSKKSWQTVQLGFQWRTLTPYAHCREPLTVGVYRMGTLMPGVLTGLFPWLIGLFSGNPWFALMGLLFVTAAGGDLLILWLIRGVAPDRLIEDHPSRAGCYVLEPGVAE